MIQRRRMMQFFIDATIEIIDSEGIESVTIRKVADRAGYNSATIYNYFKNLDHLKFFSVMSYMQKYFETMSYNHEEFCEPIKKYKYIWHEFARYAFKYPKYFKIIFFGVLYEDIAPMLDEYYELFPEHIPGDTNISKNTIEVMLRAGNLSARSMVLMDEIIENGYLSAEKGRTIDEMVIMLFENLLNILLKNDSQKEDFLLKFKNYLDILIPDDLIRD